MGFVDVLFVILGLSWLLVGASAAWPKSRDMGIGVLDVGSEMPGGPRRWWPKRWDGWVLPSMGWAFILGGVMFVVAAFSRA